MLRLAVDKSLATKTVATKTGFTEVIVHQCDLAKREMVMGGGRPCDFLFFILIFFGSLLSYDIALISTFAVL